MVHHAAAAATTTIAVSSVYRHSRNLKGFNNINELALLVDIIITIIIMNMVEE